LNYYKPLRFFVNRASQSKNRQQRAVLSRRLRPRTQHNQTNVLGSAVLPRALSAAVGPGALPAALRHLQRVVDGAPQLCVALALPQLQKAACADIADQLAGIAAQIN